MNIMTNLNALHASRQLGIHSTNFKKSTEKLSSGYKINRAADGAAELGISEQMRSQVRGLNRSVTNAEEGANFIQTGDGSMNEIHDMLHRMRELSVQSLNDTNTQEDRAALAAEFNELQSEIDRISKGTYFNTQPVFQEHEASYYQIAGNRKWAANQQHAIAAPDNSLTVHLPSAVYAPDDTYTIEVPDGIYTTQELIDEIEDAFLRLENPANPGFVLEFTDEGYCNLNFENADGEITKIDSVDGSLAYLIYDCCNGSSNANLLGTTIFNAGDSLEIVQGINDSLSFIIEKMDGSPDTPVSLTIPSGYHSREDIIRLINEELAKYPEADGVTAKEYGTSSIQVTGGPTINITGLKGNMFTIEPANTDSYTGVFYDNISPAISSGRPAQFNGKAYYNADCTQKISIQQGVNDQLKLTFDGKDHDYQIPAGNYFIAPLDENAPDKEQNLTYVLNDLFKKYGPDISVSAEVDEVYVDNIGTKKLFYLCLESKSTQSGLTIQPDSSAFSGSAYESLFCNTTYSYDASAYRYSGSNPSPAVLYGRAPLTGTINIPSSGSLNIQIDGNSVPVTVPAGQYTPTELVAKLNEQTKNENFEFEMSGSNLTIKAKDLTTHSLGIAQSGDAYAQLFVGSIQQNTYTTLTDTGQEWHQQGITTPPVLDMASVTMPSAITFPVTTGNQNLYFELNGVPLSITIPYQTYHNAQELETSLNNAFNSQGYKIAASITNDKLSLSTVPDKSHTTLTNLSIKIETNSWNHLGGIVSSVNGPWHPNTPVSPSNGGISYIRGVNDADYFTLDNNSHTFTLSFEGVDYPIDLTAKGYTKAALITELQTAIDNKLGSNKIRVYEDSYSKCINLDACDPGYKSIAIKPTTAGSFYTEVLCHKSYSKTDTPNGYSSDHTFPANGAFIIGRSDLVNNSVEITADLNDTFTLDFSYKASPADPSKDYTLTLRTKITPGTYTGSEISAYLQEAFQKQLDQENIQMDVEVRIGGYSTGVVNANDDSALQIYVKERTDANNNTIEAPTGTYTLDGVRGNAAYSIFYKTLGKQQPSYVTGAADISDGIIFEPGKNVFSFKVDGVLYQYEFPDNTQLTADEFIDILNDKFTTGDVNGNTVELKASLENGHLRLTYKKYGPHTITEVGGSAKGTVFYHEENRDYQDPYMLQVGALGHQGLELTRLRVNTASLGINSVTISRPKYANKALDRLDRALDLLSTRRSLYGALQNRIEFLTSNNRNTSQNLQASESNIRDADMASEMIDHMKNKIMTQASEAALAQANQLPSTVLAMLQ